MADSVNHNDSGEKCTILLVRSNQSLTNKLLIEYVSKELFKNLQKFSDKDNVRIVHLG